MAIYNCVGGAGGSSGGYVIKVTTNTELVGQTLTATKGSVSKTAVVGSDKLATFKVTDGGVWTITEPVSSGSITVNLTYYGEYAVTLYSYKVYGISRNVSDSSSAWTRTDASANFSFSASIGSTAGSSDFDDCYPWSDIERVTINGDVMVKIPKFWYERKVTDGVETIRIADRASSGFDLHPAFSHNGETQDYIYVGAYKMTASYHSVSGAAPLVNITRAAFRTGAKARGTGYGIIDISTISAIQMLMMVEVADNDMQTKIGAGWSASGHSAAINTGSCDSVANLTGRPSGTTDQVDVVWRGLEGFWGNVWEWSDGLNFNGGTYYVCNDQDNYADDTATNYTALSYTGATNWSSSYITTIGCDSDNEWAMMPSAAGSGSASTYYTDAIWSSTGWRVFLRGGYWYGGSLDGLFASLVSDASSTVNTIIGSRLLYIP